MTYDFDKIIERHGSGAVKYDGLEEHYGNASLLPLWVADMDFETPAFIVDALKRRLEHPVLGYTVVPEELWQSIIQWNQKQHGWEIQRSWLTFIPGIVKGIGMVINVFTSPGDKIIIQPPVYHPFRLVPECNNRRIVNNHLIHNADGTYQMNLEHLEQLAQQGDCRLLILSNPHNPAGIVWPRETLQQVAQICNRHGILVISDEIHCDMALFGNRHVPFASVSDEARQCSITFAAPSKTFNIAGVVSSYAVVPSQKIRSQFYSWLEASEFMAPTLFAPIATIAAYNHGEEWRRQMLQYVEQNVEYLISFCRENLPAIKPLKPQASFLVWLDCRELHMSHNELIELFEKKARLALNDGEMFGPGGEGHMRLNVGCPRSVLATALKRLQAALNE